MNPLRIGVPCLFSKSQFSANFFEVSVEIFNNLASKLLRDKKEGTVESNVSWSYKGSLYYFSKFSCGQSIDHYM